MSWFSRKKKKQEVARRQYGYGKILLPGDEFNPVLTTREYRLYKKSQTREKNWYERLVSFSSKFMKAGLDKNTNNNIRKAIEFTNLKITAEGVGGLFLLTIMTFVIMAVMFFVFNLLSVIGVIVLAALGMPIAYYLLKYPINLVKQQRIEASSQVVLAILYMVISMRISPNLERALRFTSSNITGELAKDMRRLIWDIEMRKYHSADDALSSYIVKWKAENEEFSEALRLIKDSQKQMHEKARGVLDQALEVILSGTKTRMKHYVQDLKMPVMVIHMMGIVLPILGTIITPLAAVFMSEFISPLHFIIGYDLVLPIVIIWFINNTLRKRPVTVSEIDISGHPELTPSGKFRMRGKDIPAMPIGIVIMIAIMTPAFLFFMSNPESIISSTGTHDLMTLGMSCMIILSMAVSISVFYILSNFQKVSLQRNIQSIENESELALFQLGNKISGGTPTEVAIEKSIDDIKDLKIAGLFRRTLSNIRALGMTFENALFDKRYGSLNYYPSRLLKNVMRAIVDTSKRGLTYASETMLKIARYLKSVRQTQEYIRDVLSDTVSSMQFQALFLTPIITGLIVSMSQVIMRVLTQIGVMMAESGVGDVVGITNMALGFSNMKTAMSAEVFQLIIGVYMLQVVIILVMFTTKIKAGNNKYQQRFEIGKTLIVAVALYIIVALISTAMFGELIGGALDNMGI
jgi:hypothetical protein